MFLNCLSVFIGGGIGSLLRYFVSMLSKKFFLIPFLGTFIANILGCFIIGYVFALTLNKADVLPHFFKPLLVTGFLGGLTTFSTLNIEVFELIKSGKILAAVLYLLASLLFGLFAAFLGYFLYTKF